MGFQCGVLKCFRGKSVWGAFLWLSPGVLQCSDVLEFPNRSCISFGPSCFQRFPNVFLSRPRFQMFRMGSYGIKCFHYRSSASLALLCVRWFSYVFLIYSSWDGFQYCQWFPQDLNRHVFSYCLGVLSFPKLPTVVSIRFHMFCKVPNCFPTPVWFPQAIVIFHMISIVMPHKTAFTIEPKKVGEWAGIIHGEQ